MTEEHDPILQPVIQGTREYDLSHIIHPALKPHREPTWIVRRLRHNFIRFFNFEGLKSLEKIPKNRGESWEQKHITQIPHKTAEIVVAWNLDHEGYYEFEGPTDTYILENSTGVTVGQYVEAMRECLSGAEEKIKSITHALDRIEDYTHDDDLFEVL